ncbi:peptidase [Gardnerella vaginalis]|uniref:peptidase n=1 Tax=Gardnerella vaginalis TaxID=2702 RepID=UPI0039EE21B5
MISSNSGKHARKVTLDAAVSNAIAKAVDARKVAAFTVGAAGVLAGAAFAFGATPAMAAENGVTPDTKTAPVTAGDNAGADKKAEDGKNTDAKPEVNEDNDADNKGQAEEKSATDNQAGQPVVNAEGTEVKAAAYAAAGAVTDRAANPAPATQVNSEITISKDTKDTLPNLYAWGSSNNTYIEKGQSQSVTFKFAKPSDGSTITKVAIFPSDGNTVDNNKSRRFLEYYSDSTEHQPYSGEYAFATNPDGSVTLTMNKLYRNNNMAAEKYAANRCIYVYGTDSSGKEVLLYKTNIARAATLVPPKTAGSIVLKYNQELTAEQIQNKLKDALDAPTEATGNKSIRDQITDASKSKGVGVRNEAAKTFTNTPDTAENKVIINDQHAYMQNDVDRFNRTTSKQGATETTYITTVQTLKTHLITDTGYTSDDLPLTVARYDDRIQKPIVEDLTNVSDEVKTEIKRKLAHLNHVSEDSVVINDDNTVTINFTGVDEKDAPKIALRDLVLKQIAEDKITVPANDKAVFVANPLGYSSAEIDRIKTAIYEANKDNPELGLTSKDQITLSYLTGDLTASGDANKGISNGQAENKITVKIKTDKSVAEFTSNVKESKLTKLPNIRTDYDVTWTKTTIDGRDTDEGISWSNDQKTTIIYRYDPTKAQEFDTTKILGLLTATPKDNKSGLRTLNGGELLSYEGTGNNARKSHMHYALQGSEPTGELTLGNMGGAYWSGNQKVSNSDVDLGDNLSIAGPYSWDPEAGPVTVAGKKDKIFKARLFVEPYAMTYYKDVYLEKNRHPGNTAKAINVIFVPQTNHKTKDLSKSIGEHKTETVGGNEVPTQSAYYNASKDKKDAYDKALSTAKTLYESVKGIDESKLTEDQKAQIDNATINLNKAREALDGDATKKEELQKSIDENGTAAAGTTAATGTQATNQFKNVSDPDFKTPDGKPDETRNNAARAAKTAYDKALEEANKVKNDDNATQKAVDDAKAKLDAAREKLNEFTTNKDELNNAIAQHGKVDTGRDAQGTQTLTKADPTYQNSTPAEQKAYDDAVAEADRVSKEPNASQKEVNKAIEDLKKAKADLDKNATDKSPLDAAVQKSFDNPDPNDATKQSVFYTNAKNKTTNPNASQEDKAAAQKAIDDYDKALAKAKEVLATDKATKKDVEDAKKALEDAEKALHADTYQTNPTDLGKAIADNFSGYLMPAYFNAFDLSQSKDPADSAKAQQAAKDFKAYNDAYHAAKDLMDKAKQPGSTVKQDEVDKVKEQLIEARNAIDKYATDTSKISAALLQSLAIHNSPAYKNASANTDPNSDEAKAKAAYDEALDKLQKAFNDDMDKDVDSSGKEIPESVIPVKDGDTTSANYLDGIQAHAKKQPLNRDVTKLLAKLKEAVKGLDKFKTNTDDLIKSINEDATTHPSPAFKNASVPNYQKDDGSGADTQKNTDAKAAAEAYGKALAEAKAKLNDPTATQKDINDAKVALDNARKELEKYNTDTTKLKDSVDKHGNTQDPESAAATEGTVTSDAYRNASDPHFMKEEGGKLVPDTDKNNQAAADKKAYDEALTKAQELLKKHNDKDTPQDAKPTQTDINKALDALDKARTKLDAYKTDTSKLSEESNKSTADGAAQPTAGSFENSPEFKNADADTSEDAKADVKAYKDALKKARDLVKAAADQGKKNSERPTQQQINEALEALKNAKKQITDNYKTNAAALKAAKDFAAGDFKNTPEYKNAKALKDNQNADADKKSKAKADVDALDRNTNDGALNKAIGILQAFDDDGKPNVTTGARIPTQKEVDDALKTLQEAMKTVAEGYKTDVKPLSNEVGDKDDKGKDVIPPFEASVPYKNALEKAKTEDAATTDPNSATVKLKEYTDKLAEAQKLIDQVNHPDPNAKPENRPTQKQVDDALAALKKAKKDIDDNFKTKVDKLQNEVDDKNEDSSARTPKFEESTEYKNLKGKTKGDKKPDDLVAYEQALAKAKELIDKNDGKMTDPNDSTKQIDVPKDQLPTQKEVDEAKKALKEIKDKILANYKTNSTELQMEVDKSKDGDDDQRDTTFENTPEFKNATDKGDEAAKKALDAYTEKLKAAKALLDKFDRTTGKPKTLPAGEKAPTQKQLDDALDALQAAKKKITDGYKTNKSDLNTEADKDGDFIKTPEYQNAQTNGDDESKKALEDYKKALEDANKILGDENSTQAQVDEALKKLQDAKKKLTDSNKTDKSKLQDEADDDAKFRKSLYFIIGKRDDIEAYKKALAEADSVLNDPNATQAQVDEALRKLQAAKYKLNHPFGAGSGVGSGSGYDTDADAGDGFDTSDSQSASVDKSALQVEVNNSEADSSAASKANTDAARAYVSALAEANSVLNDPNATQAQVDEALRKLQAAKAAWRNASGASGNASALAKTGAATGLFASLAAVFSGLGAAGIASRRRKHSNE